MLQLVLVALVVLGFGGAAAIGFLREPRVARRPEAQALAAKRRLADLEAAAGVPLPLEAMPCTACHGALPEGARLCPYCGQPVMRRPDPSATLVCHRCAARNPGDANRCCQCGAPVGEPLTPPALLRPPPFPTAAAAPPARATPFLGIPDAEPAADPGGRRVVWKDGVPTRVVTQPTCAHLHSWRLQAELGSWRYYQCQRCPQRKAECARKAGASVGPLDDNWVDGGDWTPYLGDPVRLNLDAEERRRHAARAAATRHDDAPPFPLPRELGR